MDWYYLIISILIAFSIGFALGGIHQASYWALKSKRKHQTPVHHNGKFYFVVAEADFLVMQRKILSWSFDDRD